MITLRLLKQYASLIQKPLVTVNEYKETDKAKVLAGKKKIDEIKPVKTFVGIECHTGKDNRIWFETTHGFLTFSHVFVSKSGMINESQNTAHVFIKKLETKFGLY